MKRALIICVFLSVSRLFAGLELGVSLGYGFPAGGELRAIEGTYNEVGNTYSDVNHRYVNRGDGLKIDVEGCYYLAEYFGILVTTGVSFLGGYASEVLHVRAAGSYLRLEEVSAGFVPLNVGLRFRARTSLVDPFVSFAPGLLFPFGVNVRVEDNNSIDETEQRFDMGAGFSSAAGCLYRIRYDLFLKAELNATYAFAAINEEVTIRTPRTPGAVVTDIDRYENDTPGAEGQNLYSFSSVGIRVGVIKTF